jgi:hypothetical protein
MARPWLRVRVRASAPATIGMLIDDATMQVSFLKDLVTLRNPASDVPVEQQDHRSAACRVEAYGAPPTEPRAVPAEPGRGQGQHVAGAEDRPVRLRRGVRGRGDGPVRAGADRVVRVRVGRFAREDPVGHPQPRGHAHLGVPAVRAGPPAQGNRLRPALLAVSTD